MKTIKELKLVLDLKTVQTFYKDRGLHIICAEAVASALALPREKLPKCIKLRLSLSTPKNRKGWMRANRKHGSTVYWRREGHYIVSGFRHVLDELMDDGRGVFWFRITAARK